MAVDGEPGHRSWLPMPDIEPMSESDWEAFQEDAHLDSQVSDLCLEVRRLKELELELKEIKRKLDPGPLLEVELITEKELDFAQFLCEEGTLGRKLCLEVRRLRKLELELKEIKERARSPEMENSG